MAKKRTPIPKIPSPLKTIMKNTENTFNEAVENITEVKTQEHVAPELVNEELKDETAPSNLLIPNDKLASENLQKAFNTIVNPISNMPEITNAYVVFYNAITRVLLKTEDDETCNMFLNNVCSFIKENNKGAFSPKKAYRWFDSLPGLSYQQAKEFQIILQILVDYVNNPKIIVNSLNWEKVEETLIPKSAGKIVDRLQLFINYYN